MMEPDFDYESYDDFGIWDGDDTPPNFIWWAVVMGLGSLVWIAAYFGGVSAGW